MTIRRNTWTAMRRVAIVLGVLFTMMLIAAWIKPSLDVAEPQSSLKRSPQGNPATGPGIVGNDLGQRIKQLEGRSKEEADVFAEQKEEMEYLTHLIEAMMTVAGIFAIFLAAASWTALEGQRKAAELQLADLKGKFDEDSKGSLAKIDRLREELQLDFPMLGRIQANFVSVLLNLRSACQSLVPRDDTYDLLGWKERQEILFYENAITTALLLNTKGHDKELSEIYRLLGIFYGSRFNSKLKDNMFHSYSDTSDFDRAHFYFERAINFDPSSYITYFHAGHFTQYYDDLKIARISRNYFDMASQIGRSFQRPVISIALIELEGFADPEATLETLERAKKRTEYDLDKKQPRQAYILYLEACALCLKATRESGRAESLQKATDKLLEAVQDPSPNWKELKGTFEYDRSKYFSILTSDSECGPKAEDVIQRLDSLIN